MQSVLTDAVFEKNLIVFSKPDSFVGLVFCQTLEVVWHFAALIAKKNYF